MRKLFIRLVIILIVIVAGAIVWLGLNVNSLVAKHRGDIETALASALKTNVKLGAISATIFPNTALLISDLNLGGGLTLTGVSLKISPRALLTGTIKINELAIDDPSITIVQTDAGFGLKGLPANDAKRDPNGETSAVTPTAQPEPEAGQKQAGAASPVALALDSFALRNGSITVALKAPAKPIVVEKINVSSGLQVKDSSVTLVDLKSSLTTQDLTAGARADRITANIATSGVDTDKLVLETPAGEINLGLAFVNPNDGKGTLSTTTPLSLKKVAPIVAQFVPLITNLGGNVALNLSAQSSSEGKAVYRHGGEIALSDIAASFAPYDVTGLGGVLAISGDAQRHELRSESINLSLNDQPLSITTTANFDVESMTASLARFNLNGFGGTVATQGDVTLKEGAPLAARVDIQTLSLSKLLSILRNPALTKIEGTLHKINADINSVHGAGLLSRLSGNASFDVRDGSIPGLNILGPVLKALEAIPVLTGKGSVPPAVKAAADSPNTAFKSVTGTIKITNGVARTEDLLLFSPLFDLRASGSFSTAGDVLLRASIFLEPGISAALAGKQARKILDADGRLEVPLALSGKPGAFTVVPDINRLLETATGAALQDGATKLLEKALGGGKKGSGKGLFGF